MKASNLDTHFFENYLRKKGLNESTISLYLDTIMLFLSDNPDIDNIDSYNMFLKKHSIDKKSSYAHYAIKNYIKCIIEDTGLKNSLLNNLIKPKQSSPEVNKRYISPYKRRQVISNMRNEKHRLIARIQYHTGARARDILRLQRGSINFENYQGKELVLSIQIKGKGGKVQIKYIFDKKLQEDVLNFIEEHYLDDEYYFINLSKYGNTKLPHIFKNEYNQYMKNLKFALKRSGVNKYDWATHDFRRNIARDIWEHEDMGKDVHILQGFLGHADVSTTMRYLKNSGLENLDVSKRLHKDYTEDKESS